MPIGKNAIKRVSNNGYSNVKTAAPDMENSVIEEKKSVKKQTAAKKETVKKDTVKKEGAKKTAPKKQTVKNEPVKSYDSEPDFKPTETLKKVVTENTREGDSYVNLGGNMPYYLL